MDALGLATVADDHLVIPLVRHSLDAVEDSVGRLTVVASSR